MTTYADCGSATACAAGTETLVATLTALPGKMWRIRKIRVAATGDSADEAIGGFIELKIDGVNGPFKFPVGGGVAGGTSGVSSCQADEIDVDIPLPGSATVKIYATMTEACDVIAGIIYVG